MGAIEVSAYICLLQFCSRKTGETRLSEITDYLSDKIVRVRFAKFVGEVIWVLGFGISVVALLLKVLLFMIPGFSLLFVGLYLSVHYELQRLDYLLALEKVARYDKQQ